MSYGLGHFPAKNQERMHTDFYSNPQHDAHMTGFSNFRENQGFYFNKNGGGDIKSMDEK